MPRPSWDIPEAPKKDGTSPQEQPKTPLTIEDGQAEAGAAEEMERTNRDTTQRADQDAAAKLAEQIKGGISEKNILDCEPGHWETLAEPITLAGRRKDDGPDETVTIPAGSEINVLGVQYAWKSNEKIHGGRSSIKIVPAGGETYYLFVEEGKLANQRIKVRPRS